MTLTFGVAADMKMVQAFAHDHDKFPGRFHQRIALVGMLQVQNKPKIAFVL